MATVTQLAVNFCCDCLWMIMIVIVCAASSEDTKEIPGVQKAKRNDSRGVLSVSLNISAENEKAVKEAQEKLLQIYTEKIKPLTDSYLFSDLNIDSFSEEEIFAKPMIVFLGPWSTGKSTIINYLLDLEDKPERLYAGLEPTTSDFTVVMHGPDYRVVEGIQLVSDKNKNYGSLQKFGLKFLERFQGTEFPSNLLKRVTLVDTPGIIENKKQQERGYPFNDVCQWFIDRAQLIFLVFDPSKLDVGSELEVLFKQLKGNEAKFRLILNKADTVSSQELMRVYGALFWALAPLVHEVEPPRVYVVSLWSPPFKPETIQSLFYEEEVSLLRDLQHTMIYHLENKIAAARRHAFLVRLHALVIDSYYNAFFSRRSRFFNNDDLWADILINPEKYHVFKKLLQHSDISKHDLPTASRYEDFFSKYSLDRFSPLSSNWFYGETDMDRLVAAIKVDLPNLLHDLRTAGTSQGYCAKDSGQC